MLIIFQTNQLCLRGTSVAVYDYALNAKALLGHEVIIASCKNNNMDALPKFQKQFEVFLYDHPSEIDKLASDRGADFMYMIKSGRRDGIESKVCKNLVHAVFLDHDPHGHRYAYVSEWLARAAGWAHYVPHIVEPLPYLGHLRQELGIPENALVFGRHGGNDTFDLPFVKQSVVDIAKSNPEIYFLFLNTDKFCTVLKNVIHLKGTSSLVVKSKFIHTCDAMLHGRGRGETFGLSVGEFSTANKPVLTWSGSPEKAHIEVLGDKGLYYRDGDSLKTLIKGFSKDTHTNWDCYSERFSPNRVMEQFERVYLN